MNKADMSLSECMSKLDSMRIRDHNRYVTNIFIVILKRLRIVRGEFWEIIELGETFWGE